MTQFQFRYPCNVRQFYNYTFLHLLQIPHMEIPRQNGSPTNLLEELNEY